MQPPDPSVPGGPEPVPPVTPPIPPPAPGAPPPPPPTSSAIPESSTPPPPPAGASSSDDRTMALLAHIGGALTCIVAPLIIWLLKKEQGGFVEDQAKEALNFQITVAIVIVGLIILSFIPLVGCITAPLSLVVALGSLVLGIVGGIKANEGKAYRYPFALRLVK